MNTISKARNMHMTAVTELAKKTFNEAIIIQACKLHDIGYLYPDTGFHPVDGFLWCTKEKINRDVTIAVLYHGNAKALCPEELKRYFLSNRQTRKSRFLTKCVDWCDMRTSATGEKVSVTERHRDILNRYGANSLESKAFKDLWRRMGDDFPTAKTTI